MRMAVPASLQRNPTSRDPKWTLQRKCPGCQQEEEDKIQRKEMGAGPGVAPPIVHEVLGSPGQPLDAGTRAFMEPRFGHDFSKVRVHADAQAAESASAVGALAYTVGSNVVFGTGEFNPRSSDGRRLLAHELVHVIQQAPTAQYPSAAVRLYTDNNPVQRDLATEPPAAPAPAQPALTPAQINEAIRFNRARYDEANTRLIQNLLGGPLTGTWTAENIEAIAATQEEFGLQKDGKVGDETFRFLNREQRLEGMSTHTEDCLVSFRLVGPDPVNFGRDDPTHCHFGSHHRIEAQFSQRCNCAQFQYRQFIAGHWRRTRGGVVTDLPIREPGGVLLDAFNEDADVTDPVPNYGHRADPPGAQVEDHYIDAAGNDDQAHGCRYRAEDFPGFNPFDDCLPGDRYDLLTRFRGEIQRNGVPIQTNFWTEINLVNWTP
jgi:hypothetical protein